MGSNIDPQRQVHFFSFNSGRVAICGGVGAVAEPLDDQGGPGPPQIF